MEIGIRLLSLLLSFLPAQLYKHAVYTVSFGRQTAPDAREAGEDGNLNYIKHLTDVCRASEGLKHLKNAKYLIYLEHLICIEFLKDVRRVCY